MAHTWQLLIFTSSALVLISTASTVLGKGGNPIPNSVSYIPSSYGKNEASTTFSSARPQDLMQMATVNSGPSLPMNQPSIYHSIIDRAHVPSQPASPIQATMNTNGDLHTAAGHHHGHAHGKYYEYREVPKKKTWKFGYKRGNHKHTIERHEHGKAGKHPHFKTKVKWHDKKSKGKGIHLWDYNHHDKKHYHHG